MQPSVHPAVAYLNCLFEPEDLLCISLLSTTKKFANGQPLVENKFIPMAKVITPAGIKRLTALNRTNHIYVSMCTFQAGSTKRIKSNIERVAHVFVDADDDGPKVLAAIRASVDAGEVPPPNIVVESSPNKFQAIWNIADFDVPLQEAMNRTLQQRFGTDAQTVDATRVLRAAGFANLKEKYGPVKPIAKIIEHNRRFLPYSPEDFHIALTVQPDRTVHVAAASEEVQQMINLVEAALDAAQISHGSVEAWTDAWKIALVECPFADAHENGNRGDAIVAIQASAKPMFKCLHRHCAERNWVKDFRPFLELRAGKKLRFKIKAAKKAARKVSQ